MTPFFSTSLVMSTSSWGKFLTLLPGLVNIIVTCHFSSDLFRKVTCDMKHDMWHVNIFVTCDMCHVTCDMWHVTCDMCHVISSVTSEAPLCWPVLKGSYRHSSYMAADPDNGSCYFRQHISMFNARLTF